MATVLWSKASSAELHHQAITSQVAKRADVLCKSLWKPTCFFKPRPFLGSRSPGTAVPARNAARREPGHLHVAELVGAVGAEEGTAVLPAEKGSTKEQGGKASDN